MVNRADRTATAVGCIVQPVVPACIVAPAGGGAVEADGQVTAMSSVGAVDEEIASVSRRNVPTMRGVDGLRGAALLFAQYPAVSLVGDGQAPLQILHRAELHEDASFARRIVGTPRASDRSVPCSDAAGPGGGIVKRVVPPELLKELAELLDGALTRKSAETTFLARHGDVVSQTQAHLTVTEIGVRERRGTADDGAAKRQRIRWFVTPTVRAQLGLPAAPPVSPVPAEVQSVTTAARVETHTDHNVSTDFGHGGVGAVRGRTAASEGSVPPPTPIPQIGGSVSTIDPTGTVEHAGGTTGEPLRGICEAVRRLEQLLSVVASASQRQERTLQCLADQVAGLVTASHQCAQCTVLRSSIVS